jgi:hypothetical protein
MQLTSKRAARDCGTFAFGLLVLQALSGFLVVGVSSRGGWFVWPRSFGLLLIFGLLVILLLRRRR